MATNFVDLRGRLRESLLSGTSLEFAIRAELRLARREERRIAMAMLIAVLKMPDEAHPELNTRPSWVDVERGLIRVNDVIFAIGPTEELSPSALGARRVWSLFTEERVKDVLSDASDRSDLASFVGLSAMFRSGGRPQNFLKWVDLLNPPSG